MALVSSCDMSQSSNKPAKQFQDPDSDSDSSQNDLQERTIRSAWNQLYEHSDRFLLGFRKSSVVDLATIHREPVQVFRLWQIYLDNVNPLLKVTYTPGLQSRIIGAAANIAKTSPPLEALMFSIYCSAV